MLQFPRLLIGKITQGKLRRKGGNMGDYYRQRLGQTGETLAALYLQKRGYRILEQNFRTRAGEIDIIAAIRDEVHFIEVKTRTSTSYGSPAEAVTRKKQVHLRRAAACYMAGSECRAESGRQYLPHPGWKYQFDVIEIQINHLRNAF